MMYGTIGMPVRASKASSRVARTGSSSITSVRPTYPAIATTLLRSLMGKTRCVFRRKLWIAGIVAGRLRYVIDDRFSDHFAREIGSAAQPHDGIGERALKSLSRCGCVVHNHAEIAHCSERVAGHTLTPLPSTGVADGYGGPVPASCGRLCGVPRGQARKEFRREPR